MTTTKKKVAKESQRLVSNMSGAHKPASPTWASVASRHSPSQPGADNPRQQKFSLATGGTEPIHHARPRRSPSPSHRPRSSAADEDVYVLTLLTDSAHHARMTSLRKRYFPPRLNKLSAHLTIFHALPAHKLDTAIIPALERLAAQTAPFRISATTPFRMKKGVAISLARNEGARKAGDIHRALQEGWRREGWLSEQDAAQGWRGHYTIMNKVDDQDEVDAVLAEVKSRWKDDVGTAEGLGLWKYERGWWVGEREFAFSKHQGDGS